VTSYPELVGIEAIFHIPVDVITENIEVAKHYPDVLVDALTALTEGDSVVEVSNQKLLYDLNLLVSDVVPSRSRDGVYHEVTRRRTGNGFRTLFCTCEAFRYQGTCTH
jgi:hypothetical protein